MNAVAEYGAQHERAPALIVHVRRYDGSAASYLLAESKLDPPPCRVAVRGGGSNRSHRPPKVIRVLGVVKCDHFICKGEIEQREHTGALCRRQAMRLNRRLGDFVQ